MSDLASVLEYPRLPTGTEIGMYGVRLKESNASATMTTEVIIFGTTLSLSMIFFQEVKCLLHRVQLPRKKEGLEMLLAVCLSAVP